MLVLGLVLGLVLDGCMLVLVLDLDGYVFILVLVLDRCMSVLVDACLSSSSMVACS
jgi:hypothetical protein